MGSIWTIIGVASLETGLGGEASGAKIDVGQFSSSGGDRWTIGGLGFEGSLSRPVSSVMLPPDHLCPSMKHYWHCFAH